jgi:hypothetical protein
VITVYKTHSTMLRNVSLRHKRLENFKSSSYKRRSLQSITLPRKATHFNTTIITTRRNAIDSDIDTLTYTVGKSITLFTFFYTSLNYLFYRSSRKENEKEVNDHSDDRDE